MTVHGSKDWSGLTPDERMDRRFAAWADPGMPFANPDAEKAYKARVARLTAAMRLQGTPDRVPVPLGTAEVYPALRKGLTYHDAMYDFDRAGEAFLDFNLTFQPDSMVAPLAATLPGEVFDEVDYRLYSWPGHGVPKTAGYQYNEGEYMLAGEYDAFIADPSDFLLRTYLPRICGKLAGFSKLGTAMDPAVMVFSHSFFASWGDPEVRAAVEAAMKAGERAQAWYAKLFPLLGRLAAEGFPGFFAVGTEAPFDFLGDNLRGTREVLMDMYRHPDKVLAACERLVPLMVRWVTEKSTPATGPGVFMPLHKGADGFMSDEQFRTFYWPYLLEVIKGLNEQGFVPILFAEGAYGSRLEKLAEDLPPGKTVWIFDRTDMKRAKETVGQVACIQGNVPLSLFYAGTPRDVTEYCARLIETCMPGGGFMLDVGAVLHQAFDENVKAMIQAAHDYGVYR